MYLMVKRKVHDLLDVFLLVLVLNVHHYVQHVLEVLEGFYNLFLLKNLAEIMFIMAKKKGS